MAQQWELMLRQLNCATRILRDGHRLIPAWRIETRDGLWLILTPVDQDSARQHRRVLDAIRRFMAWKGAESFVLVGDRSLRALPKQPDRDAVLVIGHVPGERWAFLHDIARTDPVSFGALQCIRERDVDPAYWRLLPKSNTPVLPREARLLASLFAADGEFPAARLPE